MNVRISPKTESLATMEVPHKPRRNRVPSLLRRPVAVTTLSYLVLICLACAFADLIWPIDPLTLSLGESYHLPSLAHPLGTDLLGRDVLARLLHGGAITLLGVGEAVLISFVIGVVLGLVAGYFGGWTDSIISRIVDIVLAIPNLIVVLTVIAMVGQNVHAAMLTFGLFAGIGLVRVVAATTRAVRDEPYVIAARIAGVPAWRIMGRHILPRLAGPIIVQLSLFAGIALIVQAGLAFLGLGVVAPEPSWGGLILDASKALGKAPWLLVPSGGIVALTIVALSLFGDSVRDATVERWQVQHTNRETAKRRAVRTPTNADVDSSALLSVRGLEVEFVAHGNAKRVVNGVDFDVRRGEILGLVGESGSGKSVSVFAILGLLTANGRPVAGTAVMDGEDLLQLDKEGLYRVHGTKISLVAQEPMSSLDPSFTVENQLVEVIRTNVRVSRKEARARALQLLDDVQLVDPASVLKKYPFELSGGMAQRVVIALALAAGPKLLIADEPTTALDVSVQAEILDLLRSLRDAHGLTILIVTHNLGVVADLCDRVVVMQQGQLVESAATTQLFADPQHDYTKQLIAASPSVIDLEPREGIAR